MRIRKNRINKNKLEEMCYNHTTSSIYIYCISSREKNQIFCQVRQGKLLGAIISTNLALKVQDHLYTSQLIIRMKLSKRHFVLSEPIELKLETPVKRRDDCLDRNKTIPFKG
jgi:hypothetical protein